MTSPPIDQVGQLCAWLQATNIGLLELRGPGQSIRLCRQPSGDVHAAEPIAAPAPVTYTVVRAGFVGRVLHMHPLRTDPLIQLGQKVEAGQTIALLAIGMVLLSVTAPRSGVVSRIVSAHASVVGFGAPLLELA